ncbi:hypothetical protein SLEP1_g548 [Rubroshorea leprosula]|uniref:Uncharacterized protein n=1 Tax=Rubroshorea leprosula TaxID=152421 RepID=A0AAV5HJL8_9ROSI|nr:hypothetical protein SLEP1_g548 [Rubroshorea leprosula]
MKGQILDLCCPPKCLTTILGYDLPALKLLDLPLIDACANSVKFATVSYP